MLKTKNVKKKRKQKGACLGYADGTVANPGNPVMF